MSIKIGANLDFRGKDPNFARDQFETLSEMKSISDNAIDEGHISYCKETGLHYEFKSENSIDENTGKWREFKPGGENLNLDIDLEELSLIHTNGVESMESCFRECHKIKNIPLFDTSNIVNLDAAFSNCFRLETIPPFNVSKVTNMSYAFSSCYVLKTIPELDTGKVENFKRTFDRCFRLISLPKLDFKSANNISRMFVTYTTNTELTTLGGFENLGQAYLETQRAHFVDYTLELQYLTKLTEQSLINVLTNVYNIASKGVETQQIILGADNLAKLTSEEGQQALTRATNYGWTIS